jgi:Zn-dependent protease
MSVFVPTLRVRGRGVVLARYPVPIVVSKGSLVPVTMLAALFVFYSAGARPLFLVAAALAGGVGGALSLLVHELGHVGAARKLKGVRPVSVSLLWLGAGTKFEGAYRSGRDQVRVALAGPAASFFFAIVLLVSALMPVPRQMQYGLFGLALLNAGIAVVSMLPVAPLDGHKCLVGTLWRVSGSERRARAIVRRTGKAWLAVEMVGCVVLASERPALGVVALVMGGVFYAQKRLIGRPKT